MDERQKSLTTKIIITGLLTLYTISRATEFYNMFMYGARENIFNFLVPMCGLTSIMFFIMTIWEVYIYIKNKR